ncbi:MAG: RNA 2',3'-cyclic phosphodiesterase [Candidatus Diapherotrites archaeon]
MSRRIFVAINIPEEIKKEIYEKLSSKIPKEGCKVVAEENLHITLQFIGYVPDEEIPRIREKMLALNGANAQTKTRGFAVSLSGAGEFGGRVLWLGAKEGDIEICSVAEKLGLALGIKDARFHPHVTLARNKSLSAAEFGKIASALEKENYCARFEVKSADLMESILKPQGPEYKLLFSAPL